MQTVQRLLILTKINFAGHLLTHRRTHDDASEEATADSAEAQTEVEECLTVTTDSTNKFIKVELETVDRSEQR